MAFTAPLSPDNSSKVAEDALLALYFSSSWCPECIEFTPTLKTAVASFKKNSEKANKLHVVYVSSDESSSAMIDCMKKSHGAWSALQQCAIVLKCEAAQCACSSPPLSYGFDDGIKASDQKYAPTKL
eukprot:1785-Heterococcus_DN1.PRE.5